MIELRGENVTLRLPVETDIDELVRIRRTPDVSKWWRGDDVRAEVLDSLADEELEVLVVELAGEVIGAVQWSEEADPEYRHASIDIFIDPAHHGRGLGTEAVRLTTRFLVDEKGHHRITIDPAAHNVAAINAYTKAGFRRVGVMHRYELGADGTWHDGLLMELVEPD